MSFLLEFLRFLQVRKKYWLLPVLMMTVVFGGLIVLTQGSAVAPFITLLSCVSFGSLALYARQRSRAGGRRADRCSSAGGALSNRKKHDSFLTARCNTACPRPNAGSRKWISSSSTTSHSLVRAAARDLPRVRATRLQVIQHRYSDLVAGKAVPEELADHGAAQARTQLRQCESLVHRASSVARGIGLLSPLRSNRRRFSPSTE